MTSCSELRKLDEAHSLMVGLVEQGFSSSVLYTVASVLSQVPDLDNPRNDAYFWQQAIVKINTLADSLTREEFENDAVFDPGPEDWGLAETLDTDDEVGDYDESALE